MMEPREFIQIENLEKFASTLPNDNWYELKVYFRKTSAGVEVRVGQNLQQYLPEVMK